MSAAEVSSIRSRRLPASDLGMGVAGILAAVVLLSLGSTMVKSAGSPGPVVAFWRLLTGAVLWQVVVAWRARSGHPRMNAVAWKATLVPGVLFGINLSLFFSAATRAPIAHVEFIGSLAPLIIVPFATIRLGERVSRRTTGLALVALLGIALILLTASGSTKTNVPGDLLTLGAMGTWCLYLVRSRTVRTSVPTTLFMTGLSAQAAATVLPVALWVGRGGRPGLIDVSAKGALLIATMAVSSGLVAHGVIAWAQQRVPVSTISILQLAQPGLGTFWAFVFLGEDVRPIQLVGMAVMLAAVGTIAVGAARQRVPLNVVATRIAERSN